MRAGCARVGEGHASECGLAQVAAIPARLTWISSLRIASRYLLFHPGETHKPEQTEPAHGTTRLQVLPAKHGRQREAFLQHLFPFRPDAGYSGSSLERSQEVDKVLLLALGEIVVSMDNLICFRTFACVGLDGLQ